MGAPITTVTHARLAAMLTGGKGGGGPAPGAHPAIGRNDGHTGHAGMAKHAGLVEVTAETLRQQLKNPPPAQKPIRTDSQGRPLQRQKQSHGEPFRIVRKDGYIYVHDLPIVDEHDVFSEDGHFVQKCDAALLHIIADNNNKRIEETGDLAPITIGHTDDDSPEDEQPEIIGYARDFHVAPLFDTDRQAIFVTARFPESEEEKIRSFPRRSVELWLSGQDSVIDPIALLGATTPERDLGLLRLSKNGRRRVRYSMAPRPRPRRYAAEDWQRGTGERGGTTWTNTKTGEVRYGEQNPGGQAKQPQGELGPQGKPASMLGAKLDYPGAPREMAQPVSPVARAAADWLAQQSTIQPGYLQADVRDLIHRSPNAEVAIRESGNRPDSDFARQLRQAYAEAEKQVGRQVPVPPRRAYGETPYGGAQAGPRPGKKIPPYFRPIDPNRPHPTDPGQPVQGVPPRPPPGPVVPESMRPPSKEEIAELAQPERTADRLRQEEQQAGAPPSLPAAPAVPSPGDQRRAAFAVALARTKFRYPAELQRAFFKIAETASDARSAALQARGAAAAAGMSFAAKRAAERHMAAAFAEQPIRHEAGAAGTTTFPLATGTTTEPTMMQRRRARLRRHLKQERHMPEASGSILSGSDDLVGRIVAALDELDYVKWAKAQMRADQLAHEEAEEDFHEMDSRHGEPVRRAATSEFDATSGHYEPGEDDYAEHVGEASGSSGSSGPVRHAREDHYDPDELWDMAGGGRESAAVEHTEGPSTKPARSQPTVAAHEPEEEVAHAQYRRSGEPYQYAGKGKKGDSDSEFGKRYGGAIGQGYPPDEAAAIAYGPKPRGGKAKKKSRHYAASSGVASGSDTYLPGEVSGDEADEFRHPRNDPGRMPAKGHRRRMSRVPHLTSEQQTLTAEEAAMAHRLRIENEELRGRLRRVEGQQAVLIRNAKRAHAEKVRAERERMLMQLSETEGYHLNRQEELDDAMRMNEDQWQRHVARIRKRYAKAPVNHGFLPVEAGNAQARSVGLSKQSALDMAKQAMSSDNPSAAYDRLLNGTITNHEAVN